MNIAIIGSGYVGLVTGVCLAEIGHRVICVDNDRDKIRSLKKGKVTIYEPGLQELMLKLMRRRRLSFSDSIRQATRRSQVIFIAVGTPPKKNGDADLTYVENVARELALSMDSYKLVVEKSTVPAETGRRIERTIQLNLPRQKKGKKPLEFDVASNPEFLKEGSAIADFMNPDRIVIGVESRRAEDILRDIYKPLKARIVVTNINSSELIKHASNSFLATKISFANALSQICSRVGADVLKVTEGMGLDHRIGHSFLNAGVGYGGSCFPKDVDAFIRLSERCGYDFRLLKEVRDINEEQKTAFVKMVEDKLWILKGKMIGIWGLAFKPNTDDMRNASSVDIINNLLKEGARVKAFDPQAMKVAKKIFSGAILSPDPYAAVKDADCLLILTEWDDFKKMDMVKVKRIMRHPIIFDGRNLFKPDDMGRLGFEYYGIGRGQGQRSV